LCGPFSQSLVYRNSGTLFFGLTKIAGILTSLMMDL